MERRICFAAIAIIWSLTSPIVLSALQVESCGEESGSLQVPAPLIRVAEGTEIVVSIRNDLDVTLQVHGLCAHDESPCASLDIPPASSRGVRFTGRPVAVAERQNAGGPLAGAGSGDHQMTTLVY